MMKKIGIRLASLALLFLPFYGSVYAAGEWEWPHMGRITLPAHVTMEKGSPHIASLHLWDDAALYFKKNGVSKGSYYLLSYANPPDFSYGWAASLELGRPFLLKIGEIAHKNDSTEKQMDVIADYINQKLLKSTISYRGEAPLSRYKGKDGAYWEGSFTVTTKEKDVTYREAYQLLLRHDGYFVYLGIINSDAEAKTLTETIRQMVKERKASQEKDTWGEFLKKRNSKNK